MKKIAGSIEVATWLWFGVAGSFMSAADVVPTSGGCCATTLPGCIDTRGAAMAAGVPVVVETRSCDTRTSDERAIDAASDIGFVWVIH